MSKVDKAEMMALWIAYAANHGCATLEFVTGCELLETNWEYYLKHGFVSLQNAANTRAYGAPIIKQEPRVTRV